MRGCLQLEPVGGMGCSREPAEQAPQRHAQRHAQRTAGLPQRRPRQPPTHCLYSGHSVSTISLSPTLSGTYSHVRPCANLRAGRNAVWRPLVCLEARGCCHRARCGLLRPLRRLIRTLCAPPLTPSLLLAVLEVPAPLLGQHLHVVVHALHAPHIQLEDVGQRHLLRGQGREGAGGWRRASSGPQCNCVTLPAQRSAAQRSAPRSTGSPCL